MSLKLCDIAKKTKTLVIQIPEVGDLKVKYRLYALTPEFEDKLKDAQGSEGILRGIAELIEDWDLLGDDGKPLKVNVANLRQVPTKILDLILKAIREANSVGEVKGGTSDDGLL